MKVAVLTVSDRVSRGEAEDGSGDLLESLLREDGFEVDRSLVADERADISRLTDSLRQDLSGKNMQFIDPDRDAFRKKLQSTSFYKDWRGKLGEEGWKLLEAVSGPLT